MSLPLNTANLNQTPLNDFLRQLETLERPAASGELAGMITRSRITLADVADWIDFNPEIYGRKSLAVFEHAEVRLLCWKSKQLTPIHDHSGSACAIRVLQGTATEITYEESRCGLLAPSGVERFRTGMVIHSWDKDIHQMGNLEPEHSDLVTLHCYSPPLVSMQLYDENETFFKNYDALHKQAIMRQNSNLSNREVDG